MTLPHNPCKPDQYAKEGEKLSDVPFQHFSSREELEAHLKWVEDNKEVLPF